MSSATKKRKTYPSASQKARLMSILEADPELRGGKFSTSFTTRESTARWMKIAEELNSIPGTNKTWNEWRKCWQDMKSRLKRSTDPTVAGQFTDLSHVQENIKVPKSSDSEETGVNIKDYHAGSVIKLELDSSDSNDPLNYEEEYLLSPDPPTPELDQAPEVVVETTNTPRETPRKRRFKKVIRRPISQAKLEIMNHLTVNEVKQALKEKNEIKKQFYAQYMVEIRKQTQALVTIARKLCSK